MISLSTLHNSISWWSLPAS